MVWFLILLSGYLGFFLLRKGLPVFSRLALDSVRLLDGLLASDDSDAQLEVIEDRTSQVLVSLLLLLALTVGVLLVTASLPWAWGQWMDEPQALEAFARWQGILALSVGGTVSFVWPRWPPPQGAYSSLDKLLHRIALDHRHLHGWLHEREVKRWRKRGGQREPGFLLVTGLARSGTTSLLQRLMETGAFSSLNYAHMPFVLAPNTWRRFHRVKQGELKERSHGDGILIGADSAEALEEPFWRMRTANAYIGRDALVSHAVDEELHGAYLDYQGLVREEGRMYLAKNNNAILRYPGLRALNRDFTAVMMFREPIAHAASLLAMHERYLAMQEEDPFVWTYMDWLAHHEFGLGQRPFLFEGQVGNEGDPVTLDYWLDRWSDYHEHALSLDAHRLILVDHATWSAHPDAVLRKVLAESDVKGDIPVMVSHDRQREADQEVDPIRLERARALYDRLVERALHLD